MGPSMLRTALLICVVFACHAKHESPDAATTFTISRIQGDACAANVDRFRCELAAGCTWSTIGADCPADGSYCQTGACYGPTGGGIGIQGTCGCGGSDTCFEQISGPVVAANVQCTTPSPGGGDACARIAGQGTCLPSHWIQRLCICDNRL